MNAERPIHLKERTYYSKDPDERPSTRAWCGYVEDEGRWDNRLSGSFTADSNKATCGACVKATKAFVEELINAEDD